MEIYFYFISDGMDIEDISCHNHAYWYAYIVSQFEKKATLSAAVL